MNCSVSLEKMKAQTQCKRGKRAAVGKVLCGRRSTNSLQNTKKKIKKKNCSWLIAGLYKAMEGGNEIGTNSD